MGVGSLSMTNNDEKFQQRWEFRRGGVDGDTSSDDSKPNSNGDSTYKKHKPVTDLVLLENDETGDTQEGERPDKIDAYRTIKTQTVEAAEKKTEKPSKKRNVVKKKRKPNGCSVKENKRKRKVLKLKEMVNLKDLKTFADSLIHQLAVDRQNMFAHMREEMGKLVASGLNPKPIKKKVRCSQKKKVSAKRGTKTSVKPQKCNGSAYKNVVVENDKVLEPTTTNEPHKSDNGSRLSTMPQTSLANGSDQVVSSSYLTLQNLRNRTPSELPMKTNFGSEIKIGKLSTDKRFYHRPAELQPEDPCGSFSNIYQRSIGLLGQNCSQRASLGVGFPIQLNQGMGSGSSISSLTYCDNSFVDNSNNKVGPRMNSSVVRIPEAIPALSERVFTNGMSTFVAHKADGEFVKDGQFYQASLRKER